MCGIMVRRDSLIAALRRHFSDYSDLVDRIESDDLGHFLAQSADNPAQVSYADKEEYRYSDDKRKRTTLGRYLTRHYGVVITPTIEKAISAVLADIAYFEECFEERTDVCNVYDELADVADSCMVGKECLEFYERNGVRVLTYTPPGEDAPVARALLWDTDQGKFIDRIYPNSGPHIDQFIKYAEKRGYMIRPHHRAGRVYERLTVSNVKIGPMPYLDTFCYLDGTTLTTENKGLLCHNTDGSEPTECPGCGEWTFDTECEGYCEDCFYNRFKRCHYCQSLAEIDDVVEIDGYSACPDCADRAYCCDECDELTFDGLTEVDDVQVCAWCRNRANQCDRCGSYSFEDMHEHNGSLVCSECAECAECAECNECSEVSEVS